MGPIPPYSFIKASVSCLLLQSMVGKLQTPVNVIPLVRGMGLKLPSWSLDWWVKIKPSVSCLLLQAMVGKTTDLWKYPKHTSK